MPANMVLLEKITVGAAGASSVTFSGIPQTGYTDLVVKASIRDSGSSDVRLRFNGNTSSIYTERRLYGNGASTGSDTITQTSMYFGSMSVPTTFTANTFSNMEIYIPNYTSSTNKSLSTDGVTENNATTSYQTLHAGLFADTTAISSINIFPDSGSFQQFSTFYLYGVAKLGTTPAISPYATGGDTIMTDGTYWYHAFLASGTFTPQKGLSCDVLVVAGGGGGAGQNGGGGGAGGLRLLSSQLLTSSTNYTCTVGAGAAATTPGGNNGLQGSNSSMSGTGLTTINATGGGYGSTGLSAASSGGSGGGGGAQTANSGDPGQNGGAGNAGSYSPIEGYAGGRGTGYYSGGGGGGAGAVGSNASTTKGGDGGVGATSATINAFGAATSTGQLSGGNYYYAGGGGGATGYSSGTSRSSGGLGGGGLGGVYDNSTNPTAGTANTGGGGGGQPQVSQPTAGGGSGIVIVRYAV